MSYPAIPSLINEWMNLSLVSEGKYYAHTGYGFDYGEPTILSGSGIIGNPKNKITIEPYQAAAGSVQTIGCSLDVKVAIDSLTEETLGHRGGYVRNRDIALNLLGPMKMKNVGSADVAVGDTVIPSDGGFEKMTATGQYSVGKALQPINSNESGYIWVNPDYEKPII